jgi:hypothetical protein
MRWMVTPYFAVSRFEEFPEHPQKAVVVDMFSKDVCQYGMIDIIEAAFDVSFDEPFGPCPGFVYLGEGRMASPLRSETVGSVRKLGFVICFKY